MDGIFIIEIASCVATLLCLVERVSFRWFFAWLASNVIWNVRKQDLCQNKKNFYEEHAWKNADFFSRLPFASTAFIDLRKCHNVDEKSSEVVLLFLKFRFSEKATKMWKNLPLVLTLLSKCWNNWEIFFQIVWPPQCIKVHIFWEGH